MNYIKSYTYGKGNSWFPYSKLPFFIGLFFCSILFLQCKKSTTTTSSSAKLGFSANLLFFDTVFTTQGSTVRVFVVRNNNNQAINISSIKLAGTYTSPFKINVDGVASSSFSNIKIPANDSIYVFATVNVNPGNPQNPAFIRDSLVFMTNGNEQYVDLWAFGWDAYYYVPNVFPPIGPAYSVLPCSGGTVEWKNDKPHVVFGYLADTTPGCTFLIDAGTQVFLHDSAVIFIGNGAAINVAGTKAKPVTFQGDRLEPDYKYLPGQWNKIWLSAGSTNNNISWAVIQNGSIGVEADTNGTSYYTLKMDHTIIKGMSSYGLLGAGATIKLNNCVIADCQSACAAMFYGGNYHFYQCTFADYWGVDNSFGQRGTSLIYINNGYTSYANVPQPRSIDSAFFGNCIIYGPLDEEVGLDSAYNAKFNYNFQNCVIKTLHNTFGPSYHYSTSNWINGDPLFYNPAIDDYHVSGGSPALNNGDPIIGAAYKIDLDGTTRGPTYTIGAYQQ